MRLGRKGGYTRDTFEPSLDYERERLLGRVTLDYVGGYAIKGIAIQTYVGSFKTVNLYLEYKIPGERFLKNTTVALHFDNVLDEKTS